MLNEKDKNTVKIICSICAALIGVASLLLAILTSEYLPYKALHISFGIIIFLAGLIASLILDYTSGSYECACCSHRFRPTPAAYIWGVHTVTKRYLKCPKCGRRSFCKRKLDV